MEKPVVQPCAEAMETASKEDKFKDLQTPVVLPVTHKRTRSRHLRTGSTAGSISGMGDLQGTGMRIRGVEPWGGSWSPIPSTAPHQNEQTEEQGITLPDFPVFGGSQRQQQKATLSLDIPVHTMPAIPSVAIVPSTPCATSPDSKGFTFPTQEAEEGRIRGFTFGRPAPTSHDLAPAATPTEPTPHVDELPIPLRKKRHSHTRSTSISTRASIIPSSPPSRTPSPDDPGSRTDERRKTLSTLEGRLGTGIAVDPWNGNWSGNGEAKKAQRRRSRVSVMGGEKVEIALPVMEDSEDEVSFFCVKRRYWC